MPERKTKRVGRPRMANGIAKARIVPVRFSPKLFAAVTREAKASKLNVSEWIRSTLSATLCE
jgi:hypothetical protein